VVNPYFRWVSDNGDVCFGESNTNAAIAQAPRLNVQLCRRSDMEGRQLGKGDARSNRAYPC